MTFSLTLVMDPISAEYKYCIIKVNFYFSHHTHSMASQTYYATDCVCDYFQHYYASFPSYLKPSKTIIIDKFINATIAT